MHPIAVRLDDDQIRRLDAIAAELGKRIPGVKVTRCDAVRATVERALVLFETDLGLAGKSAE